MTGKVKTWQWTIYEQQGTAINLSIQEQFFQWAAPIPTRNEKHLLIMQNGTPEQIERVTQAFLPMKKFDLAELKRTYEGR